MKNALILAGLIGSVSFAASANTGLNVVEDKDTSVLKHKKGWASVLTLKGDRGTGLTIEQGNKTAKGISMKSGQAKVTLSPSYVAAGVSQAAPIGINRETAAVVFKVEGAKLDNGTDQTFIAFDVKRQKMMWIRGDEVVGELAIPTPSSND
ncbi:hypothetical protein [Vibrio owensii]|uniref:hypothetical protein n=1 Tax=Vibrio owensii TaxID=696485 RepID=UPI000597C70E|nr:hypothetical protein [Vibrio owensii]